MTTSWRVMINPSLWDYENFKEEFVRNHENKRVAQSKGRCHMVVCPKKGDLVSFVIKGKIVMRGVVDSDGFENGTDHHLDPCNVGSVRPHSLPHEFVWVRITDVGLSEHIRRTGQRTWAKMPN